MKTLFFNIAEEKQIRIENAAVKEFADVSFKEASLNIIISTAGVSKGGMFKYIESKKDLYLFIFEKVLKTFFSNQQNHINVKEPCYVKRIFEMVINNKEFYLQYPEYFKMMVQVSNDIQSPHFDELIDYTKIYLAKQSKLLQKDIDWKLYKWSENEVKHYLHILFQGINTDLLQTISKGENQKIVEYIDGIKGLMEMTLEGMRC